MQKYIFIMLVCCSVLALTGCQRMITAQQVIFSEQEPGVNPYQTRILVTAGHLRIDEGEASTGYVLFDRKTKIIYNVNDTERTVMSFEQRADEVKPPFALTHTIKELGTPTDAPKINNITPMHRQFFTNNELCMNVISVDGLLPDVVKAMDEYQNALANDSASTFYNLPADLHKPCDMAISVFAPARQFRHGFPVREWRENGFSRLLNDFNEAYKVDRKLFVLPADYFKYTVQQFRDGVVDVSNRKIITP